MVIETDAVRFEQELNRPGAIVLLACLRDSPLGPGHEAEVSEAAVRLGGRVVCLRPAEEDWEAFRSRWGIGGTPTYVLFRDGRELARKRGRALAQEIVDFVMSFVDPAA